MPVKVNRLNFLRHLEAVQSGLSPSDIFDQSSCFAFMDGYVYTYNDEVSCRTKSILPKNMTGAVQAAPLLSLLSKYTERRVEVLMSKGQFIVKGKTDQSWVAMEKEISMPLQNVDKIKKDSWQPLHEDFIEAVNLVKDCAAREAETFSITCVHIHPKWIEASDNDQMARYRLPTGVEDSVLIKRDTIKHIIPLGMTEISIGEGWVHFRNETGLRVSCRRWIEDYPDWAPYFKVKGTKTSLPKGLVDACDKAKEFSQQNDKDIVKVNIEGSKLLLEVDGVSGGHKSRKKIKYKGPPLSFWIGPELLTEIVKKRTECIMSESAILINGGKWVFGHSFLPSTADVKRG